LKVLIQTIIILLCSRIVKEVNYVDVQAVKCSHLHVLSVTNLDARVYRKNNQLASLAKEHLRLRRISTVSFLIHGHTVNTVVVLTRYDKNCRRGPLLWLFGNGEAECNEQALGAAVAAWEADWFATGLFDVWLDPFVLHWSAAKKQE